MNHPKTPFPSHAAPLCNNRRNPPSHAATEVLRSCPSEPVRVHPCSICSTLFLNPPLPPALSSLPRSLRSDALVKAPAQNSTSAPPAYPLLPSNAVSHSPETTLRAFEFPRPAPRTWPLPIPAEDSPATLAEKSPCSKNHPSALTCFQATP